MKTLEEICEEYVERHMDSYRHFRERANATDTTTGEGKRKQGRFINSASDYYNLASAVEMCLRKWRSQSEAGGEDGQE